MINHMLIAARKRTIPNNLKKMIIYRPNKTIIVGRGLAPALQLLIR